MDDYEGFEDLNEDEIEEMFADIEGKNCIVFIFNFSNDASTWYCLKVQNSGDCTRKSTHLNSSKSVFQSCIFTLLISLTIWSTCYTARNILDPSFYFFLHVNQNAMCLQTSQMFNPAIIGTIQKKFKLNWQSWDWAHSNKLIKRRKTQKKWSWYVERFSRYDSGKFWEIATLSEQKVVISRNAGKWNEVAISHDALH